jgi:hypothetical protein
MKFNIEKIRRIITHTSPDWDAIGAAWLVQRFLLPDAQIICADRETIEKCMSDRECAVVDCGGQYGPPLYHFDHHHLPGEKANQTCATQQVFEWAARTQPIAYLAPIVDLIWAGDTGRNLYGADVSREVGLHALLAARKAAGWTDEALIEWGCQELDLLAGRLKRQSEAAAELNEKCVWQSNDGKVVAVECGEPRHSQAAFATGATLVVFRSDIPTENGTSYAIGVQRNQAAEFPHVGELLGASEFNEETQADNWFRHPAGFMAGRGTGKAQRFDPVPEELTLEAVARAIDAAWER